ncbi:MAG: hypothetical protein DRR08_32250 [Candidatus Parabeggiatoa sp. nov. 2]|nr:MAG: hypothetical protein DRR08_32250 [Gammaproteobacteria bacterium]
MSENLISIMSGSHTGHDFYQRVSGIIKGNQDNTTQYLEQMAVDVERLSERILYAPNAISVLDVSQSRQRYVDDLRDVRASLEPVQRAVGEEILSSAMIFTPQKMQKALAKSPWEVLMDIRPVNLTANETHTDMTSMLFSHNGVSYLGWQMRGALPQLFNCQYDELWRPNPLDLRSSSILCGNKLPENMQRLPSQVMYALQGHKDWVNSVAFSPDGHLLASGGEDRTIKLWNVSKGKELRTIQKKWWRKGHEAPVRTVAFSPDGRTLASGSDDNTIRLWDVKQGKALRTLPGDDLGVRMVAFSPDGRILASEGETAKLWEVSTGKKLRTLKGVNVIAFSPDGRILASGGPNNSIKLWDVSTGKELTTLKRHLNYVVSLAFSPDGRILASSSEDKTVKLWDLSTGKALRTLKGHEHSVCSVAFRPDGRIIASASADKTIKLWEMSIDHELCTLQGHDCLVNSLAFSPDGRTLATASNDKTIKLWR